ncbi:42598_t:CDS:1, partial [Gigaspora margarita]
WNFLHTIAQNPEIAFIKAFNHYVNKNTDSEIKQPTLPSKFYIWTLDKFGPDAQITNLCFEDILKARISLDRQLQQNINADIPIGICQHMFQAICNNFKVYCNTKNFYQPSHLSLISQCTCSDILAPLFKNYLPDLFDMEISFKLPMQITEEMDIDDDYNKYTFPKSTNKRKRNNRVLKEWYQSLYDICVNNTGGLTNTFRNYLHEFIYEKLPNSEYANKKSKLRY